MHVEAIELFPTCSLGGNQDVVVFSDAGCSFGSLFLNGEGLCLVAAIISAGEAGERHPPMTRHLRVAAPCRFFLTAVGSLSAPRESHSQNTVANLTKRHLPQG